MWEVFLIGIAIGCVIGWVLTALLETYYGFICREANAEELRRKAARGRRLLRALLRGPDKDED